MGYISKANIGGSDYALTNGLYGTCSTAASTAAKVVTLADFDGLETGVTIHVKFTYSNTAPNATLNVNSTGAKNLCCYGTTRVGTTVKTSWQAGAIVSLTYDGTSWVMNDYIADTGVTTDTKNTAGATNNTSKLYLIGATSQDANPQTYSNSDVYATDGALVADSFNGVGIYTGIANTPGVHFTTNQGGSTFAIELYRGSNGYTYIYTPDDDPYELAWDDSYSLGSACEYDVDFSISPGSTSSNLPTTAAVRNYVDSAVSTATSGALTYRGTVTALTDITSTNYKKGWYWMVGTNPSITIDGQACEAGDMIIAKQDKTATADNDLDVIQTNIETLTNGEIDTLWAAA